MEKILFFGNQNCPYCRKVLAKLEEKKAGFEFNEIAIEREKRASTIYTGEDEALKGKTFGELFGGNITIPKMILPDGRKLLESDEMIRHLDGEC